MYLLYYGGQPRRQSFVFIDKTIDICYNISMNKEISSSEKPPISRRDAIKLGFGVLLGTGAAASMVEAGKHLADEPSEASCENVPVPTGGSLFDVYGNKVDSNELLRDGYADAVRQEECRQDGE